MMSEDKIVSTESENVNSVADIESEISAITNDTDGPYWNKQHPDHDKVVQQVYTLREMKCRSILMIRNSIRSIAVG